MGPIFVLLAKCSPMLKFCIAPFTNGLGRGAIKCMAGGNLPQSKGIGPRPRQSSVKSLGVDYAK